MTASRSDPLPAIMCVVLSLKGIAHVSPGPCCSFPGWQLSLMSPNVLAEQVQLQLISGTTLVVSSTLQVTTRACTDRVLSSLGILTSFLSCAVQAPLSQLAEDPDLHVRELAFAARQYAVATAEHPGDYDALYNHGLVLQELSGKLPAASAEQAAMLRQVGCCWSGAPGRGSSHAGRRSRSISVIHWV